MTEVFLAIAVWLHPLGVDSGEAPDELYIVERRTTMTDCELIRENWKDSYPDLHNNTMRIACIGIPSDKVKI